MDGRVEPGHDKPRAYSAPISNAIRAKFGRDSANSRSSERSDSGTPLIAGRRRQGGRCADHPRRPAPPSRVGADNPFGSIVSIEATRVRVDFRVRAFAVFRIAAGPRLRAQSSSRNVHVAFSGTAA